MGRTSAWSLPWTWSSSPRAASTVAWWAPRGVSLAQIEVALFPLDGHGRPASDPVRSTETESDGSFEFRKRTPGRYVVVAMAEGLSPASVELVLNPGEIAAAGTLRPRASGASVTGRIVLPSGCEPGGARLRARQSGATEDDVDSQWRGLVWSAGAYRVCEQYTTAGDGGLFAFTGLVPGEYEVSLVEAGEAAVLEEPSVLTPAPAEGLLLGQGLGRVSISVSSGGKPLEGAHVRFARPDGWHDLSTDAAGALAAYVPLERDYVVEVAREGYEPASQDLPALGRALDERRLFDLRAAATTRATLVLVSALADDHGLERVEVRLQPWVDEPQLAGPTTLAQAARQADRGAFEELVELRDGVFSVRDVPAGRYRVDVEPSEDRLGPYYDSYFCLESFDVELVAGREHRQPLLGVLGGRLLVVVDGVQGTDLETSYELLDASGEPQDVRFVSSSFEDNVMRVSVSSGGFLLDGPMTAYPNLRPGRYTLRAEIAGYRPLARAVDVFAGRTSEVALHFRSE